MILNEKHPPSNYAAAVCATRRIARLYLLTLLEPQSHFVDKADKFQVVCPQNGTAVLKGLIRVIPTWCYIFIYLYS